MNKKEKDKKKENRKTIIDSEEAEAKFWRRL